MAESEAILLQRIAERLAESGLSVRGIFNPGEVDALSVVKGRRPAKAVLLVGNVGDDFWPHFQAWLAGQPPGLVDPLDTWSREVLDEIAGSLGGRVVMPSDRPFAPFQQWAMRAEGLRRSPLGILMHPEFGLWHAYRGALLVDRPLATEEGEPNSVVPIHLCEACVGKPCLDACPVGAFGDGFDHRGCLSHIVSAAGASCMDGGCLARNACPHDGYRYGAEIQAFLMSAFREALRRNR